MQTRGTILLPQRPQGHHQTRSLISRQIRSPRHRQRVIMARQQRIRSIPSANSSSGIILSWVFFIQPQMFGEVDVLDHDPVPRSFPFAYVPPVAAPGTWIWGLSHALTHGSCFYFMSCSRTLLITPAWYWHHHTSSTIDLPLWSFVRH